MKDIATNWFHEKWSVPTEAYLECIEDYQFSGKWAVADYAKYMKMESS